MAFDPFKMLFARSARGEGARAPHDPGQRETRHRLQVGFFGLAAMILLVGLANIIMNSVKDTRASAVPEAAPTVLVTPAPTTGRDPLADAGVVPDLLPEPEPIELDAPPANPGATPPASAPTGSQP